MKRTIAAAVAVLSITAFADNFVPTGGVVLNGVTADFNDTEIRGPNISVSRRPDGSWGGRIGNTPLQVNTDGTRVSGGGILLTINRAGDTVKAGGVWNHRTVEMTLGPQRATIRIGNMQGQFDHQPDGHWMSPSVAQRYSMQLTGQAAEKPIQAVLALLSCGAPRSGVMGSRGSIRAMPERAISMR